ncbi:hypothetical protein BurJ1DRAFT_0980 [Burkholderiales bacterium JOSHI_001]|nr:hypothetical protein BurJ1DRAFT_0980 [Burkholderiales bacterium JOSHI_001]
MQELTRFRNARAPQRRVPSEDMLMRLSFAPIHSGLPDFSHQTSSGLEVARRIPELARRRRQAVTGAPPQTAEALAGLLFELDTWLVSHNNAPEPQALSDWLGRAALNPMAPVWSELRLAVTRRLLEVLMADAKALAAGTYALFTRFLLVMGLVELQAGSPTSLRRPQDVQDALQWRTVVLPSADEAHAAGLPTLGSPAGLLMRRPGFADLFVVEQEWHRYEAGQISYIENVLGGEEKERRFKRSASTVQETTLSTSESTFTERDTQQTDRSDLRDESTNETKLAVHVEGQVDVSAQYGPATINTHLGGGLDYSSAQSSRHAVTLGHEIVSRAVSRVEQQVTQSRKTITEVKNVEESRHAFKNTTSLPSVGIYRWVDRIDRARVVRYPNRFLMEFEVPEPAAWYRWLHQRGRGKVLANALPVPFTPDGRAEGPTSPRLTAKDVTADNYLDLGARYVTPGLQPPPARQWLATVVKYEPSAGSAGGTAESGNGRHASDATLAVPVGWRAGGWRATALCESLTGVSVHSAYLYVSVGACKPYLMPFGFDPIPSPNDQPRQGLTANTVLAGGQSAYAVGPITTGTVPVSIVATGLSPILCNVDLLCEPLPETVLAWQIATYEQIAAAYTAMRQAHLDELARSELDEAGLADGSPGLNAQTLREELKKHVIGSLTANAFRGRKSLKWDASGDKPPAVDMPNAILSAPRLGFLEQAFEWENLSYVLYPYFWAENERWAELQPITGSDPDFAQFLRAGSARIVVPARPGFENHVQFFLATGIMWSGGPVPAIDDEDYLSIADEIRAMQRRPADGTPAGEPWEVRVPTTLVWLENESPLPTNPAATIGLAPP